MDKSKFMKYLDYLKRKLKRRRDEFKDLTDRIESGTASSIAKERYVELKGRIQELEDDIDAAEGMIEEK